MDLSPPTDLRCYLIGLNCCKLLWCQAHPTQNQTAGLCAGRSIADRADSTKCSCDIATLRPFEPFTASAVRRASFLLPLGSCLLFFSFLALRPVFSEQDSGGPAFGPRSGWYRHTDLVAESMPPAPRRLGNHGSHGIDCVLPPWHWPITIARSARPISRRNWLRQTSPHRRTGACRLPTCLDCFSRLVGAHMRSALCGVCRFRTLAL